ncbi:c-type cytochrome [Sphingomonas humi]|uniref:Cytochrome c domain-containing protein n=1 Tax=Sphingomonas humi TaxID=335630 RepID=A0ABP7S4F1_9SPHN
MVKALRWAGYGLAGVAGLAVLAAAGVWGMSAYALSRTVEPRPEHIVMAGASAARGQHLAQTATCLDCHGQDLRGSKFLEEPGLATLNAPNLTLVAAKASDEQLAQAIRQGIGHDGRSLFIMPSSTYAAFTDQEVSDLIAFIRSLPRGGSELPKMTLGPIGHIGVALGKFQTQPALMARYREHPALDVGPQHVAGRHLAMTICADCHASDLTGQEVKPGTVSPDLTVVGSYDKAQFAALMKTGLPPGGRHLQMMKDTSRNSFSHFTDQEVEQLFGYLQARAARLQARSASTS